MEIFREADGTLGSAISWDPLPAAKISWHPKTVDVLSLKRTKYCGSRVHEVLYDGRPAVSKIACFDWQIPSIERETVAYSRIHRY